MKKANALLLLIAVSFVSFGFLGINKSASWKKGVQTVGIRVRVNAPALKVYYARSKALGLTRTREELIQRDQNTNDRMELALKDFSFPQLIFEEFKKALERHSHFKVIEEKEFKKNPPDFIFDVNVLYYGLKQKGLSRLPRACFKWKVSGIRPGQEKPVWVISKKKASAGKDLRRWFYNKAEVLQGEFRTHIIFSVQDLLYETQVRERRWGLPKNKG